MESKFLRYKYDWHLLNLMVQCTKCGNNIVFQDNDKHPVCNECGNTNQLSWENVLKQVDIIGMKRDGSDHKIMMGNINGNVRIEKKENIHCHQCNHPVILPERNEPDHLTCSECSTPLSFKIYEGLNDLVFYKAGNTVTSKSEAIQPIAVRCISCGGPLEADPTKSNFTCKFCSTENILPPALRYKVVLDDLYVAIRNNKNLKLAAFSDNGTLVQQTLRENGKASFEDVELNEILIKNKNDVSIYRQIIDEFKYLPSDKVLVEIFNTSTNPTIILQTGTRLQKNDEEIKSRIKEVTPDKKISDHQSSSTLLQKSQYTSNPHKNLKSRFLSPMFIIIFIVFLVTIFMIIAGLK